MAASAHANQRSPFEARDTHAGERSRSHMQWHNAYGLAITIDLANSVFWFVGFATSLAISGGYQPGFLARIGGARSWLLLAGVIGAFIAAFNNAMIPRIGIANLTFCLFLGQVVASALLATTGILVDGRDPITPLRTIGILLVVVGTSLFIYGGRVVRG
jgi:transporter family-2 protein